MYYRPGLKGADFGSAMRVPNERIRLPSDLRIAPIRSSAARRILIPVNVSEGAAKAIAYVVDTVYAPTAQVHLLNVQRLTMKGDFALDVQLHIESRAKLAIGTEMLNQARERLDAGGISCKTTVLFGEPAEMIAHYAREQRIDTIIMETKRLHWLNRLLSGAVSAKVTRLANTDVTLVNPAGGHTHFIRANNGVPHASRAVS